MSEFAPLDPAPPAHYYDPYPWLAPFYDAMAGLLLLPFGGQRAFRCRALALMDIEPGTRVLELGCGTGAMTRELVARGAQVTAVDLSEAMLSRARRRAPGATYVQHDILEWEGRGFDWVLLSFVLHEMSAKARREAIAVATRALRPGGRMLIVDFARPNRAWVRWPFLAYLWTAEPPMAREWLDAPVEAECSAHTVKLVESRPLALGAARASVYRREAPLLQGGTPAAGHFSAVLREVSAWLESDLREIEAMLIPPDHGPIGEGARRLILRLDERLHALCVGLAAHAGSGWSDRARCVALAAEWTNASSLPREEIVNQEGSRAAWGTCAVTSVVYGREALLFEALQQAQASGIPGAHAALLKVIEERVHAEAKQIDRRGWLDMTEMEYLRFARARTASLLGWALGNGGRAAGLSPETSAALERYGESLGIALHLTRDLADACSVLANTGRRPFSDPHENTPSYPLLLAARQPRVREMLRLVSAGTPPAETAQVARAVWRAMERIGAFDATARLASRFALQAAAELDGLTTSRPVELLATLARALAAPDGSCPRLPPQ